MDYFYDMGVPYPNYSQYMNSPQMVPNDPRLNSYQYPPVCGPFVSTSSEKSDDELWIETWLAKNGKISINLDTTGDPTRPIDPPLKIKKPRPISASIHETREALETCVKAQLHLEAIHKELTEGVDTMSSVEWTGKTQEIGQLKEQISRALQLFNPDALRRIQFTVEKRRKKRIAIRKRKLGRKRIIQQEIEQRREMHKNIDEWLLTKKEEVERTRTEENMKRDADCVLSEVTKKKTDANKILSLISSLVKLRKAREQTATQRGDKLAPGDRVAFEKVTEQLEQIWTDLLQVYGKEEQGLRIMLEQNATEDNKAALALKEQKITAEWDYILFGPKCISSSAYWALTSAKKNMETFIAVRRSWDYFLTTADDPNGSKMPIGWVLPDQEADGRWKKHLNTK